MLLPPKRTRKVEQGKGAFERLVKPNLHKTDKRYSIKYYFIGFARKFYPNLIYKHIKFQLLLQILYQQKLFSFSKKIFIVFFRNSAFPRFCRHFSRHRALLKGKVARIAPMPVVPFLVPLAASSNTLCPNSPRDFPIC